MVEVGSMEVVGVYKDGGLQTNLKIIGSITKSLKVEYQRMTAVAVAAGEAIAGMGRRLLDSITNALTSSPFLIGAITKIKTFLGLLAWEISKVLLPILEWLADKIEDLYHWFKDLNPEVKKAISWFVILAGALGGTAIAAKLLGVPLAFIKGVIGSVIGKLAALATFLLGAKVAALGLHVALGLVIGLLGVMVLDELGVLDWIADLGKNFRDSRDDGNLLADAITAILAPLALFGDLILVLVTDKTMEDFWKDVDTVTASLERLWDALNVFNTPVYDFLREKVANLGGFSSDEKGFGGSWATGTIAVPGDGWYKLHAGEQVSSANTGSRAEKAVNIILDFTGTVVNLASGMDLDDFANTVSRKIADQQAWTQF